MDYSNVLWFEIFVSDMKRAVRFYEGIFELKLENISEKDTPYMSFPYNVGSEGAGGALVQCHGKPGAGGTRIYLYCDDCLVQTNKVESFGGKVISSKQSLGKYGYYSLIEDTEGNEIGLYSNK